MSVLTPGRDPVPHPRRALLHRGRPLTQRLIGLRWTVRVHRPENVPATGPVILAANHIGVLDGPFLAICGPRPVHALTKREMYAGPLGALLRATGQVPLDRFGADPSAVRTCLRVLGDGGAVGIFPEGTRGAGDLATFHHGAAYLALVSGAPVVPVTFVGTREPGGHTSSLPRRGAVVDMDHGEPWQVAACPWPRTREHVLRSSALLLEHVRAEQQRALARIGRTLPGPLPAHEREADPATGFVRRGAT